MSTRFEMTDIDIVWNCPNHHRNCVTYSFDIGDDEDVDIIINDFCLDSQNQQELSQCPECLENGFHDVSWSYTDTDTDILDLKSLIESIILVDLIECPPAA